MHAANMRKTILYISTALTISSVIAGAAMVAILLLSGHLSESGLIVIRPPETSPIIIPTILISVAFWLGTTITEFAEKWGSAEGLKFATNIGAERLFKQSCAAVPLIIFSGHLAVGISHIPSHQSFEQVVVVEDLTRRNVAVRHRTPSITVTNLLLSAKLPDGTTERFSIESSRSDINEILSPINLCITVSTGIWGGYWSNPSSIKTKCEEY